MGIVKTYKADDHLPIRSLINSKALSFEKDIQIQGDIVRISAFIMDSEDYEKLPALPYADRINIKAATECADLFKGVNTFELYNEKEGVVIESKEVILSYFFLDDDPDYPLLNMVFVEKTEAVKWPADLPRKSFFTFT